MVVDPLLSAYGPATGGFADVVPVELPRFDAPDGSADVVHRGVPVRAVGGVARQIAAVETGGGLYPVGIACSRIQGPRPAHAVTDDANRSGGTFSSKRVEERAAVADGHVLCRAMDQRRQRDLGLLHDESGLRLERPVGCFAIEKIRHQHGIALACQPLRHCVERRSRTESVHIENDAGPGRGSGLRAEQPGFRYPVLGLDLNVLLRHCPLRCLSRDTYLQALSGQAVP